ncbi:MAG: DUF4296 domain-containing protein [Ginsengibacter sp.]
MRRFFSYILFCLVLSCSNKDITPARILGSYKMKAIMWDVLKAQALAAEVARKDSSITLEDHTKLLTKKVFEIHKITASDFDKSYDWYTSRPDIFRIMFDSLYTQKQRENDLHTREGYKPFKNDSLSIKNLKNE